MPGDTGRWRRCCPASWPTPRPPPTRPTQAARPTLAAQIHQITAAALIRLDAPDLGHVAAREALRLAALAPDPLRAASVRCLFGHVLIRQGRFVDAERVSVATAEQVQPTRKASTEQLSVYGGLLWGPPQSADCLVVAEDYVGAAEVAARMPRDSTPPLMSRSRHLADVAHAQLRLGHTQAAESALLRSTARRCAATMLAMWMT